MNFVKISETEWVNLDKAEVVRPGVASEEIVIDLPRGTFYARGGYAKAILERIGHPATREPPYEANEPGRPRGDRPRGNWRL